MSYSPSSSSRLFNMKIDQAVTSSTFDQWLQIQYLPLGFKRNVNDVQDHPRKRWYKRIKFDLNEFFHLFSIAILIVWISSVLLFSIYLSGPCSPLTYHRGRQLAKDAEESIANRAINYSLVSNNASIRFFSPLGSGLYRAHQILVDSLAQPKKRSYNEIEENLPSCIVMTAYAISNISLSTLLLLHLFFYISHIVESSFIFPWFAIEIVYSAVFVMLNFIFDVVLCIISPVRTTVVVVFLGIIQSVFGLIFLFNRYNHCQSGRLPQDLSDDVDGDYIRRNLNNLKSIFHKKSTPEMKFRRNLLKRKGRRGKDVDSKTLAVSKSSPPTSAKVVKKSTIQQSKTSATAPLKSERKSQSLHHCNSNSGSSGGSR